MIKKLFLVVLINFSFSLFAQQEKLSAENHQKYSFEEAQKALKNQNFYRAYGLFTLAQMGADVALKDKSVKKTDSLKIILREKNIHEITGNWKMITTESWAMREPSDSVVGKMITIEPNQILFYELYPKAKKWNLVQTEKLIFSDKENMTSNPLFIAYSNKEVWSYYIDKISGNLISSYIGEENENGISELVCGNKQLKYFKLQ
jgi:hypothetical protein